jgi:hypothetical protein
LSAAFADASGETAALAAETGFQPG